MAIQRVAIIFDNRARPETTGTYCRRALHHFVEVEHVLPSESHHAQKLAADLYLNIDDGLSYDWPKNLHPSALWAIDTHLDFDACLAKARGFDFVFAAQRDGAERFKQDGIPSATWLPLACDPEIHAKHEIPKQYDVAFVGNELPGERTDLLRLIQRKFLSSFVGQRYFDEMARTYSAARIVFNRSIRNDINMRVFEALACGSLLITNDLADNGQSELFQSGVHLETYRDADEVIEKIRYYLTHEDTRERIAAAGRADVLATHTYRHRMETLLERVQGFSVPARRGSEFRVQKGRDQKSEGTGKRSEDRGKISGVENQIDGLSCPPSRQLDATSPRPGGPRQSTLDPRPIRDHSYFAHCRPEVVGLLPETARQVLDIGCGAGRVGETIKQRQQAHVTGIELDAAAAALAKMRLDRVLEGNIEHMTLPFEPAEFDAVVCGDILEHLRDPLVLLRKVRTWLRPGGCIVASIPNVRHHSVVRGLINGNWTYESAGLLDGDHVRFFTRREIEKLFFRAGFDLLTTQVVPGPGYEEWVGQGKPGEVKVGRLHIGALATEEAEEFYVYQYLLVATPSSASAVRAAENSTLNVPEPQDDSSTGANLKSLAAAHPWPTLKPNVGLPQENVGWLEDGARQVLTQAISPETKLVVELGTWLGKSTRFIADLAPSAVVIAIDHWIIGIYTTIRF